MTKLENYNYNRKQKKIARMQKELYEAMKELRQFEDNHEIYFEENKQDIADAFCYLLQMTRAGGCSNFVKEMRYKTDERGYNETVTPVLADGNSNWYTAYVSGDSGIAMIMDITSQFVRKAW